MIEYFIGGGVSVSIYVMGRLIYNGIVGKPNGHMSEAKCDKRMERLTKIIETDRKELHEKINKTAVVVSRVEGYLDGQDN